MASTARLREAFALFDRDGDGELTASEALLALRSTGVVVSSEESDGMPASMSWEQFEGWVSKKMSGANPEADLIKSFKVFDTKGDGTLSTDELTQVIKTLGDLLTDDEVDKMIQDADPNKTGRINYAQFVKVLLSN
ncbi:calmodulin [Cyclospora cayetanensis]|uniref:Calmodulin n=2 Tax=Cyclospora cayetanensis TaxID=88456 RepID=A0A6P5WCR7_9EIME|nr:calmodulin [Cyclospora cayetanensis]OEH74854.1 putative calmodulin [Cyclospora cayetanensis]